jgi:APA family basic amino acid/polyamine antiporter
MPSSLRQELTFTSATALVVSNMIGTGIFTTTGFLAGDLGRPSLVIAIWLVGAVVAMAGCLSYAELGINYPQSGGEYVYLKEVWGADWGFLSGWISFFAGFAGPVAAGALAFSEYLGHFYPSLSTQAEAPVLGFLHLGAGRFVALAVIGIFVLVNVLGLRLAANLQVVLTALKIAVLGAFLILALLVGHGDWNNFALTAQRTSTHGVGAQFAVSLIFVMFAYSGWNAATYVAEEMKDPQRTLPLALITGTVVVALFYLALNVAFIYAMPLESLKGVVRVGAEAATALFGPAGGGIFSGIMAVGILSCVSAMVLVGPRVYYAMARDGFFFAPAAKISSRWRTPVQAILFQAAASGVMVLVGRFERLIYYISFALILFAAVATAGVFRMRRRPGWKRLRAVSWAYPLVPLVFVTASLWMLLYTLFLRPVESLFGLLTMGAGVLVYRLMFASRGERKSGREG